MRDDLGAAERLLLRQVEGHLRGRLGLGRVLEHEAHAVEHELGRRLADEIGGDGEADRSERGRLAEPGVDVAARAARQALSVHELRAPEHRDAREHVLARCLLEEARRRHDADLALGDLVGRDHALDAAEVIDVAVREDHRGDRLRAERLLDEPPRGGGRLARGERVDHDPAGLPLDDRHVRDVVAAHLVDAARHLEQAVQIVELRLAPQARVHRGGRVAVEESVRGRVPDARARLARDHETRLVRDQAALRVREVGRVAERQLRERRVGLARRGARGRGARGIGRRVVGRGRRGRVCARNGGERRAGNGRGSILLMTGSGSSACAWPSAPRRPPSTRRCRSRARPPGTPCR